MNSRSPFGTFCYPSCHARWGHSPQLPPPYRDTPTPQEPVALRGTLDYQKRTLPNMSTNVKHFGSSGSFAMAVPTSGPGAGLPSASAPGITPDSRTSIDQNIWRQGVFEHGCSESLIYENAKKRVSVSPPAPKRPSGVLKHVLCFGSAAALGVTDYI